MTDQRLDELAKATNKVQLEKLHRDQQYLHYLEEEARQKQRVLEDKYAAIAIKNPSKNNSKAEGYFSSAQVIKQALKKVYGVRKQLAIEEVYDDFSVELRLYDIAIKTLEQVLLK